MGLRYMMLPVHLLRCSCRVVIFPARDYLLVQATCIKARRWTVIAIEQTIEFWLYETLIGNAGQPGWKEVKEELSDIEN